MNLNSLQAQLTELQGYYTDDTKSDDDIIYAVYNWVRTAHSVSQVLLLEGHFPELRRCLDLCRNVLQELHVSDDGRRVVTTASGEDGLLMESLRDRTRQLLRQCDEAHQLTRGRDAQYYLRKLLRTEAEEPSGSSCQQPLPPERGVSFGRHAERNRWRTHPVFPPLVTQSQMMLRDEPGGEFFAAMTTCKVPRGRSSPLSSCTESSTDVSPQGAGRKQEETSPEEAQVEEEKSVHPGVSCLKPSLLYAAGHMAQTLSQSSLLTPCPPRSALRLPSVGKAPRPPSRNMHMQTWSGTTAKNEALRPLSAMAAKAYTLPRDANSKLVHATIAVKSVAAVQRRTDKKMSAMWHRTAWLVGDDHVPPRYAHKKSDEEKRSLGESKEDCGMDHDKEEETSGTNCAGVKKKKKSGSMVRGGSASLSPPLNVSSSTAAKLREVYDRFHTKSEELSVETAAMRRMTNEHSGFFIQTVPVVSVEDSLIWRSFRRAPHSLALGATTPDGARALEETMIVPLPVNRRAITTPNPVNGSLTISTTRSRVISLSPHAPLSLDAFGEVLLSPQKTRTASLTERRLERLMSATHIEDGEVHRIVVQQMRKRVADEERCRRIGKLPAPPEMETEKVQDMWRALDRIQRELSAYPVSSHTDNLSTSSVLSGNKSCGKSMFGQSSLTYDPCSASRESMPVSFLSLSALHKVPDWLRINSASVAMCLPLHLATVRLQCYARSLFAQRERRRRAANIDAHIRRAEAREEAAILIQRYVRRMIARRVLRTLQLRVSYRNDKRIASETIEEPLIDLPAPANALGGVEFPIRPAVGRFSHGTPTPRDDHTGSQVGAQGILNPSSTHPSAHEHDVPRLYAPVIELYTATMIDLPARALRRLRRIQTNIASRVIVRALRAFCSSLASRWERETHALLLYATGRLKSTATFLLSSHRGPFLSSFCEHGGPCGDSMNLSLTAFVPDSSSTAESSERTPRTRTITDHCNPRAQVVSPPSSFDRMAGGAMTAPGTRRTDQRLCGYLFTPLEHYKLSELQETLRQREALAADAQRDEETHRLAHRTASMRVAQRAQLGAAFLLQRISRGFKTRIAICRYAIRLRHTFWRWHPRRSPSPQASSAMEIAISPPGGDWAATGPAGLYDAEAHPLPPEAARAVLRGIRRRHPVWFDPDAEKRRKGRGAAATLLQAALRAKQGREAAADRAVDSAAKVIQRQWRAVRSRRAEMENVAKAQRIEFLVSLGM